MESLTLNYQPPKGTVTFTVGDTLKFHRDLWEDIWGNSDPFENQIANEYESEILILTGFDNIDNLIINGQGSHNPYYFSPVK